MKTKKFFNLALASVLLLAACKDDRDKNLQISQISQDNYSSIGSFYSKNGTQLQTYTVSGTSGGSFTSPKGTIVTIPPNAFVDKNNNPVTGTVTINFKDIYKKSDMLFSNMPTNSLWGGPIKSGGEFFIKAKVENDAVQIANGKKIKINQPFQQGSSIDNEMKAMLLMPQQGDTLGGWFESPSDSLEITLSGYIFSLYQFTSPIDSGSWCNSDNALYFSAYPQTTLTLNPLDNINDYHTDVFLMFGNVNSMVHVYYSSYGSNFPYYNAPAGLQCTVVAIGVKNEKLYSSFTPITITNNLTLNFSLTETTTDAFKNQLEALN